MKQKVAHGPNTVTRLEEQNVFCDGIKGALRYFLNTKQHKSHALGVRLTLFDPISRNYAIKTKYHSFLKYYNLQKRFSCISHVAKLVLVIPHLNAEEVRTFSMVCKNKTAFCPNLDPKGTLSSILTIKLASHQPANVFKPPKSMLKKGKTAT